MNQIQSHIQYILIKLYQTWVYIALTQHDMFFIIHTYMYVCARKIDDVVKSSSVYVIVT